MGNFVLSTVNKSPARWSRSMRSPPHAAAGVSTPPCKGHSAFWRAKHRADSDTILAVSVYPGSPPLNDESSLTPDMASPIKYDLNLERARFSGLGPCPGAGRAPFSTIFSRMATDGIRRSRLAILIACPSSSPNHSPRDDAHWVIRHPRTG